MRKAHDILYTELTVNDLILPFGETEAFWAKIASAGLKAGSDEFCSEAPIVAERGPPSANQSLPASRLETTPQKEGRKERRSVGAWVHRASANFLFSGATANCRNIPGSMDFP